MKRIRRTEEGKEEEETIQELWRNFKGVTCYTGKPEREEREDKVKKYLKY